MRQPTAILHLLLILILRIAILGNCLEFNYVNFSGSSNITFMENSTVSQSAAWLLPDPDPSLATDPNNSAATQSWHGWMVYDKAIPFLGPNASDKAHSFNTSFTFKFITGVEVDSSPSGMAFFITSTDIPPSNPVNGYFGLSDGTFPPTYFAVEFDTFNSSVYNISDPSGSHIGIDIDSVDSSMVVDTSNTSSSPYYPELYLYSNYTFRVWITYDAASQITRVWMTNASSIYSNYLNPPGVLQPIMEYGQELSSIFTYNDGLMYVGFSAATRSDSKMLGVAIYSWYFSISDEGIESPPPPPPPLTPPPSTSITAPSPAPDSSPPSPWTSKAGPSQPPPATSSQPPSPNSTNNERPFSSYIKMIIPPALVAILI